MRKRVPVFAAPFVVTVALGGCKKASDEEPPPRRPPRVSVDARVAAAAPDAAPAAPRPDARQLAQAPEGATTVRSGDNTCRTFPDDTEVECPPLGPTLTLVTALHPTIRYELRTGGCLEEVDIDCPPPDVATCNPPPPKPVACPTDQLPGLNGIFEPTKRDGGRCYWHAGTVDLEVACPVELQPAPKGVLAYDRDGLCYANVGGTYEEVRCPKGGASVIVPPGDAIVQGNQRIYLREPELICYSSVDYTCPPSPPGTGMSCNPPGPSQIECPDELMPRVRAGAKVTRKDGKCWHHDVQVKCP